jgi:hypothetical protein
MREPELAKLLKISPRTLRDWRVRRLVPFTKVGHIILFDVAAVEESLKRFERIPKHEVEV